MQILLLIGGVILFCWLFSTPFHRAEAKRKPKPYEPFIWAAAISLWAMILIPLFMRN